jgi:hypothetical protein
MPFPDHPDGVCDGGGCRLLVGAKWHVGNEKRMRSSSGYSSRVVYYFCKGQLGSGAVPQAYLGQRIANEGDVEIRIGRARKSGGVIVCRQHGYRNFRSSFGLEGLDSDFVTNLENVSSFESSHQRKCELTFFRWSLDTH